MDIRPFGDVVIDGFDIDNENHNTAFYNTFATALRGYMPRNRRGKRYYISASPQCPIPDESIPLQLMQQADFVWVRVLTPIPAAGVIRFSETLRIDTLRRLVLRASLRTTIHRRACLANVCRTLANYVICCL